MRQYIEKLIHTQFEGCLGIPRATFFNLSFWQWINTLTPRKKTLPTAAGPLWFLSKKMLRPLSPETCSLFLSQTLLKLSLLSPLIFFLFFLASLSHLKKISNGLLRELLQLPDDTPCITEYTPHIFLFQNLPPHVKFLLVPQMLS